MMSDDPPAVTYAAAREVRKPAQIVTMYGLTTAILACVALSAAITYAEETPFWDSGSAIFTSRPSWERDCSSREEIETYRIGDDIVACVTVTVSGNPRNLVMTAASNFTEIELSKMEDSKTFPMLPRRSHPRFRCLQTSSGWIC